MAWSYTGFIGPSFYQIEAIVAVYQLDAIALAEKIDFRFWLAYNFVVGIIMSMNMNYSQKEFYRAHLARDPRSGQSHQNSL